MAATGDEKSSTCEVLNILMAVRKLISDIHVGARLRPWVFLKKMKRRSQQHTMGVPMLLVSGFAVRFGFALRPSFGLLPLFCFGGLLVLLVLFASLCVLCSRVALSMVLLSCALMTRTEIASRLLIKGRRSTRAFSSPRHLG